MTTVTSDSAQYLSFTLAGEEYAVDILRVREIIEYDHLTRVPGMPDGVRGVINLRGGVVPVVDLALRFGLDGSVLSRRSCIVMIEMPGEDGGVMGIIADAVNQVLDLTAERIIAPPTFGTPIHAQYLEGMAEATGRKFVMLLDATRVLSLATPVAMRPVAGEELEEAAAVA